MNFRSCNSPVSLAYSRYDIDDGWYSRFSKQSCTQSEASFIHRVDRYHACRLVSGPSRCSDYFSHEYLSRYHTPARSSAPIPTADSTLINGLGRYASGPTSPLSVINVTARRRYRFRLVAISCDPNYIFSIDGHTMVNVDFSLSSLVSSPVL